METQTKQERELSLSQFDRDAIKVLNCLVPSQTAQLIDGEGRIWTSDCKQCGEVAITHITRRNRNQREDDAEVIAIFGYNYNTEEEIVLQ